MCRRSRSAHCVHVRVRDRARGWVEPIIRIGLRARPRHVPCGCGRVTGAMGATPRLPQIREPCARDPPTRLHSTSGSSDARWLGRGSRVPLMRVGRLCAVTEFDLPHARPPSLPGGVCSESLGARCRPPPCHLAEKAGACHSSVLWWLQLRREVALGTCSGDGGQHCRHARHGPRQVLPPGRSGAGPRQGGLRRYAPTPTPLHHASIHCHPHDGERGRVRRLRCQAANNAGSRHGLAALQR